MGVVIEHPDTSKPSFEYARSDELLPTSRFLRGIGYGQLFGPVHHCGKKAEKVQDRTDWHSSVYRCQGSCEKLFVTWVDTGH